MKVPTYEDIGALLAQLATCIADDLENGLPVQEHRGGKALLHVASGRAERLANN